MEIPSVRVCVFVFRLSEDESLRFFIDSEESNKLSNQLKYIMETDDNENGLELCLFSCTEQID